MSRLIDAGFLENGGLRFSAGYASDGLLYVKYADVVEAIRNAPTVDAVPVVRCKDCTWASWRDMDGGVWKCKMAMGDEYHENDFYCAWGERCEDE